MQSLRRWLSRTPLAPRLGGFDAAYYAAHNPDIVAAGFDPLRHYRLCGWKESRDPNAYFSSAGYLAANPDVADQGMNPLEHFWLFGFAEGRTGWQKGPSLSPEARGRARDRHQDDFVEIRRRLRGIEETVLWR